ncbi:hypothetical protein ILUMI_21656 [Ignelater luminosus]|uniref:Sidoreflexin n=1 Tax=Ignelater luminosus TaxID=2038154 RepID=A0A8K0CF85_IGNLU|nr:hypothetical protein ILUMI_21656 [Ignelater luminosus]
MSESKQNPSSESLLNININEPRYDQETYVGRAKHFLKVTNPLNVLASTSALENAKCIVTKHRCRQPLPEGLTVDELWNAKVLYDSAYHPDTGELMPLIGRMSAQVPMNMLITGGMMSFYKSTPAVIFWQWINQSFNAVVNHTNRSGDAQISDKQLAISYASATTGALVTALGLNRLVKNLPPLVGRLVPFAAVAAANCVNIPLMRSQELKIGTPVYDENNNKLGISKVAAQYGISQVILSRIAMAAPGMVFVPFVMNHLERQGTLCRYPWMTLPAQVGLVGLCLTFATPLACAFFKQKAEIKFKSLEPELQEKINKKTHSKPPQVLYYNKGL